MLTSDELLVLTELSRKSRTLPELEEYVGYRVNRIKTKYKQLLTPHVRSALAGLEAKQMVEFHPFTRVYHVTYQGVEGLELLMEILK